MKKYILLLVIFLCLLTGCNKSKEENTDNQSGNSEEISYEEIKSFDELKEKVGFTIEVPEDINEISNKSIIVYSMGLVEVNYMQDDEIFAYIRKMPSEYLEEETKYISGIDISEVNGPYKNGKYELFKIGEYSYISEWTEKDFNYSLVLVNGGTDEVIIEISKLIK